jgi:hypothetical protein
MNQIESCIDCRGTAAESAIQWECLPVRMFGKQSSKLKAVTIGLNPALNDWLEKDFQTIDSWTNSKDRLAIISDYGKKQRTDLTQTDREDATRRQDEYFTNPEKKIYPYFESMDVFLARIDRRWSYILGTVVHLDLIACPTKMRFAKINDQARNSLLSNCRKYFLRTLNELPDNTVLLLNGDLPISQIKSEVQIFSRTPIKPININGLSGISGWIQMGNKKFVICGWTHSATSLSPLFKLDLAFWVRGELKSHGVQFD